MGKLILLFVVVPLVEESEAIAARAAVAEYESLSREVFADTGQRYLSVDGLFS